MKKLLVITFALFIVSFAAEAQTPYNILSAQHTIKSAQIDRIINITRPILFPEVNTIGKIQIDKNLKMVSLSLETRDLRDPTFAKPLIQLQMKLLSMTVDKACNLKIYKANTGVYSSTQSFDEITIVDNSKNTCPTLRALAPTEIRLYRRSNGIVPLQYTVDMTASQLALDDIEVKLTF